MKSFSTLIGVLLLTTGLQVGAWDFEPWQPQPNPFYSQTVVSTPPVMIAPPTVFSVPNSLYSQPSYQAPQAYDSYDYAMDLVDKQVRRMGGPAQSMETPVWQAYEIEQRNFCNIIQANPAAQRACFDSLP